MLVGEWLDKTTLNKPSHREREKPKYATIKNIKNNKTQGYIQLRDINLSFYFYNERPKAGTTAENTSHIPQPKSGRKELINVKFWI